MTSISSEGFHSNHVYNQSTTKNQLGVGILAMDGIPIKGAAIKSVTFATAQFTGWNHRAAGNPNTQCLAMLAPGSEDDNVDQFRKLLNICNSVKDQKMIKLEDYFPMRERAHLMIDNLTFLVCTTKEYLFCPHVLCFKF